VSPRVIEDPREMEKVTEELRLRMGNANELEESSRTSSGGP